MKMKNEIASIINEITCTANADKFVMITILQDHNTGNKDYEFSVMNETDITTIAGTESLTVLNEVIRYLLNNNYFIDFEFELYWRTP